MKLLNEREEEKEAEPEQAGPGIGGMFAKLMPGARDVSMVKKKLRRE